MVIYKNEFISMSISSFFSYQINDLMFLGGVWVLVGGQCLVWCRGSCWLCVEVSAWFGAGGFVWVAFCAVIIIPFFFFSHFFNFHFHSNFNKLIRFNFYLHIAAINHHLFPFCNVLMIYCLKSCS